ncbi:hypothetical protein NDU88_001704 [Pleurodeles waltl]|uniref:Uncharacterized protein n=1 Tax=Pleurodeles waltl TaxID=8319 RepID=A0AAV7KQV9_PLEWA|nr:hypothetical protein NDU88_001704 [Pleurodeles waltl]
MLLCPRRDQDVANCVWRQRGRRARQGALSEAGSTRRSARTGTSKKSEMVLTRSCTKESPETNLESRAMQVRVPRTQAWLCTKDLHRKCTEAGVAAKVAVPSNAIWRGEARTYLHQTWTEESLDCGSHLDTVVGFKGPRSSC